MGARERGWLGIDPLPVAYRAVKSIIPALTSSAHKGEAGRVGVIGGSLEYTGAPYFAAISAMKTGADLGHVFCQEDAAIVIKSYSPELIVHPLLSSKLPVDDVVRSIIAWLPRLHALVIGPGLGRDPAIFACVKEVINAAKQQLKSLVIDADGLYLVTNEPEVITGYTKAILTPNGAEFLRLYNKVFGCELQSLEGDAEEQTRMLAAKMGGVTVLRKGEVDVISNGLHVIRCEEEGCRRRCGGQGDVLSGMTGLFSFWAAQKEQQLLADFDLPPTLVAAYGGCFMTKKCAKAAFAKHCRSMLAHDLVSEISSMFIETLETDCDVTR